MIVLPNGWFVKLLALIVAVSLLAGGLSPTEKAPDEDENLFYVQDAAHVLKTDAVLEILANGVALCDGCGSQIVVVTTRDLKGLSCRDYAVQLFNELGVGDKDKNNGFLLLMYIADTNAECDYFLATGTGAEEFVSNSLAGELLDTYLEPDFAKDDYSAGTRKLYRALFETVRNRYGLNLAFVDAEAILRGYTVPDRDS